ncbi:rhodanese-like domain-containing protein [Chloroflexota bacterium]
MIAANAVRGDAPVVHWDDVGQKEATILDVRNPDEFDEGHAEGAVNIPLGILRERMSDLPHDREILAYCEVGQRSYYASRALRLNSFQARNVSGGFRLYRLRKRSQSG